MNNVHIFTVGPNRIGCGVPLEKARREEVQESACIVAAPMMDVGEASQRLFSLGASRVIPVDPDSDCLQDQIEEVLAMLKAGYESPNMAPSMQLLTASRSCNVPFPTEILGGMGPEVEKLARLAGAPEAFIASTLMAVVSGLILNSYAVHVRPGWSNVHPIQWHVNAGDASVGKSQAQEAILGPLRRLEVAERARYQEALRTAKEDGIEPDDIPVNMRAILQNFTIEAAHHAIAAQGKGMIAAYDEFSEFMSSLRKFNRSSTGDTGAVLAAHNGLPLTVDRRGNKEPVFIPFWGFSLVGAIPPSVLNQLSRDSELLNDDGLDARLIYWRPTMPSIELRPKPDDQTALETLSRVIEHLWNLRRRAQDTRLISFDEKSLEAFERWRVDLLVHARQTQTEVSSWTGKLPGLVVRACGVLAALDAAYKGTEPRVITYDLLKRAIRFAEVATSHRRKIELERGSPTVERLAAELGGWLLNHHIKTIDTFEVRRGVVPGIRSDVVLKKVLLELQSAGWLSTYVSPRRDDALPRQVDINSAVFDALRKVQ